MTRHIPRPDPTPASTKVNQVLPAHQPTTVSYVFYSGMTIGCKTLKMLITLNRIEKQLTLVRKCQFFNLECPYFNYRWRFEEKMKE